MYRNKASLYPRLAVVVSTPGLLSVAVSTPRLLAVTVSTPGILGVVVSTPSRRCIHAWTLYFGKGINLHVKSLQN